MTTNLTNSTNKVPNVPPLRFPEFTGEWEKKQLQEECSFFSGGTPSSSNKEYYDGDIPFIRSGEIDAQHTELFLTQKGYNNSSAKMVEIGDLLLALYGATSGEIAINKIHGAINQAILCIRSPYNNVFVKSIWKKHVLHILQTYLQGGQGNLSADIVKKLSFYFPSNREQDKISEFVALVDQRIETQNKIIEDLRLLILGVNKRLFYNYNSTEYVQLGEIATITNGANDVQDANLEYTDGLYPFYDRSETIKFLDTYFLDKEAIIYPGEGSEFFPRYHNGKFALHQRCYAIYDVREEYVVKYLYYYMQNLNNYFIRNAVGSTVSSLRLDTFKRVRIPILSKIEQTKICNVLDSLSNKLQIEQNCLSKYQSQKQYLLQQMFI